MDIFPYQKYSGLSHFLEKKIEMFKTGTKYFLQFSPGLNLSILFPSALVNRSSYSSPISFQFTQNLHEIHHQNHHQQTVILHLHCRKGSCLVSLLNFFLKSQLKFLPFLKEAQVKICLSFSLVHTYPLPVVTRVS